MPSNSGMRAYSIVLRVLAPLFMLVGAVHLFLGLGADSLLGARISAQVLADPALDSQNRFYGVSFALYGVLLLLCSTDLARYATVLRCVLWVLLAAGLARFVSLAARGVPPALILALFAVELVAPPLMLWWLSRVLASSVNRLR
ncbi:MAG: DUF4345 domain-containing protein [Steroidobacteraceae bacterium]